MTGAKWQLAFVNIPKDLVKVAAVKNWNEGLIVQFPAF